MIFGHERNLKTISKMISEGNIPHVFLFSGPNEIGKRKIAFEISKYLEGEHKEDFFDFSQKECNCEICNSIENESFPEIKEIYPENGQISIKQIRKIKEDNSFSSFFPFKIFILNNIEKLSLSASGALLKTLEEPRGNTIFFLLTSNYRLVLETILSRSSIFHFFPLSKKEIENFLEKIFPEKREKKEIIIDFSLGRPGRAKKMVIDKKIILYYLSILEKVEKLRDLSVFEKMVLSQKIVENENLLEDFLMFTEIWFRDLFLAKIGFQNFYFNFKKEKILQNASALSKNKIKSDIQKTQQTKYCINFSNASKILALENLLLEI